MHTISNGNSQLTPSIDSAITTLFVKMFVAHNISSSQYQLNVLTKHSATPPCQGTKQYSLVESMSPILLYTHALSQASSRGVSLNFPF